MDTSNTNNDQPKRPKEVRRKVSQVFTIISNPSPEYLREAGLPTSGEPMISPVVTPSGPSKSAKGHDVKHDSNPSDRNKNIHLDEERAVEAYARAWNRLDLTIIEPLLDEDVRFRSQLVLEELHGKARVIEHLSGKMDAVANAGTEWIVFAELAEVTHRQSRPCVCIAQGGKQRLVGLTLLTVEAGRISAIDLCLVPSPHDARRSGFYPD
jgi:SnoaL-like domain